jgi:tripartite-type tricarboxylate transporter receptor subunit TctC
MAAGEAADIDRVEFHRIRVRAALLLAASPFAGALDAWAEASAEFPNHPVRWICPSSPGAGTDAAARSFAQIASDAWKQACIVDNRSGASGMIGLDNVAAAKPDGYTLMVMSVSQFLDGTLAQKFSFEAKKDFTPLSLILFTNPSSGIRTLKDLVEFARQRPGELNYASGGSGGITHFAMELFLRKAGIKATHVPYKGSGPALTDTLAGHVQMSFITPATSLQYVKDGKLNAIAVASEKPSALAPGIPTFDELGLSGVYITTWYGLLGPANLPAELTDRISKSVIAASKPDAVRERLAHEGMDTVLLDAPAFAKFLDGERDRWAQVAKDIGFKRE